MSYYSKLSNKENLLITLGCSWTHGVGSYDAGCLEQFRRGEISQADLYNTSYYAGAFYEGAWPKFLAELLDYDLINLGVSGDSNSASAKRLIVECDESEAFNKIRDRYKKVTVIWLITETSRFSFYSDHYLVSYNNNSPGRIFLDYVDEVYKHEHDGDLETKFYVKSVESYCKGNGFNFVYGSAFVPNNAVKNIYDSDRNIHKFIDQPAMANYLDFTNPDIISHCNHPTPTGYKTLATKLHSILNEHFQGRA